MVLRRARARSRRANQKECAQLRARNPAYLLQAETAFALGDELNVRRALQAFFDFAGVDCELEGAFDVAELFRGRDAEGGHQLVAQAGGERRLFCGACGPLAEWLGPAVRPVSCR